MIKIVRYFLLALILISNCAFAAPRPQVQRGNVIYFFESGKMQCQSEINPSKEITILLSSLKKNTEVQFTKLSNLKNGKLELIALMVVKDENPICASWTDMQEVHFTIDPIQVQNFTLDGKKVYESNGIKVLLKE